MDLMLTRWINGIAQRSDVLDAVGIFAATWLIGGLAVVAALSIARADGRVRRRVAAWIVGTVIVSYAAAQLIGVVAFRQRPFVTHAEIRQLIAKSADAKSFPSDHATLAFALVIPIVAWRRQRNRLQWASVGLLAAATGVAMGRVFVGVHYLGDVLAGAALAWTVFGCIRWIVRDV